MVSGGTEVMQNMASPTGTSCKIYLYDFEIDKTIDILNHYLKEHNATELHCYESSSFIKYDKQKELVHFINNDKIEFTVNSKDIFSMVAYVHGYTSKWREANL